MKKCLWFVSILFVSAYCSYGQPGVADRVIAVIGSRAILLSDIENEYIQIAENFPGISPDSAKCMILDRHLMEKLMLYKAEMDSIVVGEERVESEIERRIRSFVMKYGSVEKMEEVLGKSVQQIKKEYREKIKDQLVVQEVQQAVLKDVKVSPSDVRNYFLEIPADSLPYYSSEVEVGIILKKPQVSAEARQFAYAKITEIRQKIIQGTDFAQMAAIYSKDVASALKGGDLGYFGRNDMVPEFEAAAFKLKPDSISKIIETKYGFHILKLIDRKGDRIRVRHILISPETVQSDLRKTKLLCDSIRYAVMSDSITFEQAAKKYSDDEETKVSGGYLADPMTGSIRVPMEALDKDLFFILENLKPGEMSLPREVEMPDRSTAYRMVFLRTKTPPHKADLKSDYAKFQMAALEAKKQKELENWIKKYKKQAYIRIMQSSLLCQGLEKWN